MRVWFSLHISVYGIPESRFLESDISRFPPVKISTSCVPVITTIPNLVPPFLQNPESRSWNKPNPGFRKLIGDRLFVARNGLKRGWKFDQTRHDLQANWVNSSRVQSTPGIVSERSLPAVLHSKETIFICTLRYHNIFNMIQTDYFIKRAPYGFLFTSRKTLETNEWA